MEPQFVIGKTLGDAIIQYLASRPYQETFQLIAGMQSLQAIPSMPQAPQDVPELTVQ